MGKAPMNQKWNMLNQNNFQTNPKHYVQRMCVTESQRVLKCCMEPILLYCWVMDNDQIDTEITRGSTDVISHGNVKEYHGQRKCWKEHDMTKSIKNMTAIIHLTYNENCSSTKHLNNRKNTWKDTVEDQENKTHGESKAMTQLKVSHWTDTKL